MVAEAAAQGTLRKHSPASGELIAELPLTQPDDVPALVAKARAAQQAWGRQSARQRGKALVRISQVVASRADELAELIARETGKPKFEALFHEVFSVADLARYFGKRLPKILKPKKIPLHLLKHRQSTIHYVPRGVIGVIGPWNYPFTIVFGDVLMALAGGNGVVVKPSEHTPVIARECRRIVEAAGVDPELVQVAIGHGDVGAALVNSDVDMMHFTGSVATGRKISEACGKRLIPCVLELGGKDAAVVLEDADVDRAAKQIVWGAFANSGQICASVERVYAVGSVYEPLVSRMRALAEALRQGHGGHDEADVGPMITSEQLDIVRSQVTEAVADGAKLETGGYDANGYYAPTILTDVDPQMRVCREETFGPVVSVTRVDSTDTAVERANDSPYGLSAYVFTRNAQRGREVAQRLEAGSVLVNDLLANHAMPETPWGGVKLSGIGHTHGDDGLRHMCEARHINESRLPAFAPPWLFPYRSGMVGPTVDIMQGLYGSETLFKRAQRLVGGFMRAFKAYRSDASSPDHAASGERH